MMVMDMGPETFVIFNELARLIAQEDFIDFIKQPYEPVTD
jgi:hypothetical protein